jgi:AraC-like DNA-binding protein
MSSSDALSNILGKVRLDGAVYFDGEFSAPWGIDVPHTCAYAPYLSPGADHVVSYHLFLEGECSLQLQGEVEVRIRPGDLVLMPHGHAHKLWNGSPTEWHDASASLQRHVSGDLRTLRTGAAGEVTRVVCGYLACDHKAAELFLAALPPLLVVNVRGDDTGRWIESSIRHLVGEAASGRAGSGALLSRMGEALFVESLRRWIDSIPETETGWLAGMRDPVVARTLALIHGNPSRPWSVDELARQAGASRSVLAERFSRLVGETPLAYLANLRMRTAARMLEDTRKTVVEIAADVGYESEAAFNRAFKRQFGEPPARFRRNANTAEPAPAR